MYDKVIVIDYGVVVHTSIFSLKFNPKIPVTFTALNIMIGLLYKLDITPDTLVIVAKDARNSWRKDYETAYKGNRQEKREASGIDFPLCYSQLNKLADELNTGLNWHFIESPRCLSGDSLISTINGQKYLVNCKIGEKIYSWNPRTRQIEISTITKTFKTTDKTRVNIYFSGLKRPLRMTKNHPLYSKRGWLNAQDCIVGDVIYTNNDFYLKSENNNLKDLGYIKGYSHGDGYINWRKKYLMIDSIDIEGLKYIKTLLRKIFSIKVPDIQKVQRENPKWSPYYHLKILNSRVFDCLFGDIIFLNNIEYIKGFIAGFYDAEGTFNKNRNLIGIYNTNVTLIKYIEKGLKKLGFNPKVNLYDSDKNKIHKPIYRLDINKKSEVIKFFETFSTKIIRKRYNTLSNGFTISRIETIQQQANYKNYNLEVKPNNNFFANNCLVHNCEADDTMAVACRFFKEYPVVLVTIDKDLEQCWEYPNVRIFSNKSKKWKIKPNNFDYNRFISEKIYREAADNMVTPVLDEAGYEARHKCVNLLTLPEHIESAITEELKKISPKKDDINSIPFRSLQQRYANIYNDKSKVVDYNKQIEKENKKELREKTKKEKIKKAKQKEKQNGKITKNSEPAGCITA